MKLLGRLNQIGVLFLLFISVQPFFLYDIFGVRLTYGVGLGGWFYIIKSTLAFIIFLILINIKKINKNKVSKRTITTFLYLVILFFVYSLTLGRGGEYRWNGKVFMVILQM